MLAQRQELERRRLQLKKAMQQLQERERSILAARRLAEEPLTLEDLSRQFGISRERVRQIEARAIEKLQRLMTGGRRAPLHAGLKRKFDAQRDAPARKAEAGDGDPYRQPPPLCDSADPQHRRGGGSGAGMPVARDSGRRHLPARRRPAGLAVPILHNVHVSGLRRRKLETAVKADADAAAAGMQGEPAQHQHMEVREVMAALSQLPEDQRRAVTLIATEELKYEEAAKRLGIPIGTFMSRLAGARRPALHAQSGQTAQAASGREVRMTIEIDENDLHAFLDGQLAPEQEAVVLAWLETDPEARQRLHDYAEQKLLTAIGASEGAGEADPERTEELAEELGARLQRTLTKRRPLVWLRQAAAVVALVAAGWSTNELVHRFVPGPLPTYVVEATGAHLVFAEGPMPPVVNPGQESGMDLLAGCRPGSASRWMCPN